MLSVYTRHHPDCAKKDDSTYRRCRCPKWLDGTLPGRSGRFRTSAKTKSWEQAELLARKYENSALSGEDLKPAKMPTVKEAVGIFLADAEARGLAPATLQKLRGIFQVQLVGFAEESGVTFLREFNPRNLTEWRQTWKKEKELARKKKFERVIGFFWYCVRQGWLRENPTATMGRVIAKHVPTDYFTADEYKRIIGATYRLGEYAERSWAPEKRGIRIRALTELMRWSGLRIRDAVTLECGRLIENKLMLYQAKTGTPVFVPLPPHVADLLRSIPPGLKPNPNYFFWSGNGLPKTFVANWQRAYRRLFKVADLCKPDGTPKRCHCHMFRDTFAVEMLLAGVPIDQVSILLGHASVRVTEKHYSPWVRARQDQLEKSVQSAWELSSQSVAKAG
ncbi:MAG TPA: tyrosine-type recombinase/integrase [Bryobacteraceae bacterium]|nr:tyrosine-type recombinase/integrase [Bryobacteraceae bacterium]